MTTHKEKIILSDVDGVLLDWRKGFLEWLPDHITDTACPIKMKSYDFTNAFDASPEYIGQLAVDFNKSEAIKNLEPWKDALAYVKLLGEEGFRFHLCTAMGVDDLSQQYREYNLYSLYGDLFDKVQLVPVGSSKKEWLSQYQGSELFWLEDHLQNAQDGHDLGLKSILLSDVTNIDCNDFEFTRVSEKTPWKEIYNLIQKEYNEVN